MSDWADFGRGLLAIACCAVVGIVGAACGIPALVSAMAMMGVGL